MYGGAGGGGKSVALLASALQYICEPRYAALLLRRTYADLSLPDALIPLSHLWLQGTAANWDGVKHEWRFPGGSTLTFGYLEHEQDKFRYKGAAFQFIGFDELTAFSETQYRYLFSRLRRREGIQVPLRMRSATNPGDVGHEWVKRRFIDEKPEGRLFIPARLEDNPYLDRQAYEESLSQLDPVTRAQMQHGDWEIQPEGNLFKRQWFDVVMNVPPLKRVVRSWDLAATEPTKGRDPDWTAGAKMGIDDSGICYLMDMIHFRATPREVESTIKQTAIIDGYDVAIRMEQEPGSSGKSLIDHYAREVLNGWDFRGVPATGDKVTRANPFSAACERRGVKLVRGNWIGPFLDELTVFPGGSHDDEVDAGVNAFAELTQGLIAEFSSSDWHFATSTAQQ